MNKPYFIKVLDAEGYELTDDREFFTMREARQWVRESGLDRNYWVERSESQDFPRQIDTIQLVNDKGEVLQDWFPKF